MGSQIHAGRYTQQAIRRRPLSEIAREKNIPSSEIFLLGSHGLVDMVSVDGEWFVEEISLNRILRSSLQPQRRDVRPLLLVFAWFAVSAGFGGVCAWFIASGAPLGGNTDVTALVFESFRHVLGAR